MCVRKLWVCINATIKYDVCSGNVSFEIEFYSSAKEDILNTWKHQMPTGKNRNK